MSPRTWPVFSGLFLALFVESKDIFVRRAAVDASGQIRQTEALDPMATNIRMGVDAEGNLIDLGNEAIKKDDSEDEGLVDNELDDDANLIRSSSLKPDRNRSVRQHAGNLVEQVPKDRIDCQNPPIERNRHKICQHKECGLPPNAYMVGIKYDKTKMESFSSEEDANMYSYWPGVVTRTELDKHMVPTQDHCVCEGCQEWSEWAIKELATPGSCKFPDHEWRLVFSDMNPQVNREETVKFQVGRVLEVRNDVLHNMDFQHHLTKTVFTSSVDYDRVAKAEGPHTWEQAHTIDQALMIKQGRSLAVYQWVMKCKIFNKVGMYINVAEFRGPHFIHKDELAPPTCNPNQDDGFQECHKMASEDYINVARGRSEQANPTNEDVRGTRSRREDGA